MTEKERAFTQRLIAEMQNHKYQQSYYGTLTQEMKEMFRKAGLRAMEGYCYNKGEDLILLSHKTEED